MDLSVRLTEAAEQDLDDIYTYIAYELLEPAAAQKLTSRIMDAAGKLAQFPLRYRQYEHEPWRTFGWRVMPVDNYIVFYVPPEEGEDIVFVTRIIHGSRDIPKRLIESSAEQ